MSIPIRMHVLFRDFYGELQTYKAQVDDTNEHLDEFEKYLLERHYRGLKPFWKWSLDEVVDPDDHRYPNDAWLAAIVESPHSLGALKHGEHILAQLEKAWNWSDDPDFFSFDEKTKILTAYTSGWSGCEDIMYALNYAFPFYTQDSEHCVLRFDMKHFFKEDKK